MTHKATVLANPTRLGGRLYAFTCIFDEPRTSYTICTCHTTPDWAEQNPSFKPENLQIGNKGFLAILRSRAVYCHKGTFVGGDLR